MGMFSSDRTIAQYAHEIWKSRPVQLPATPGGGLPPPAGAPQGGA
jgi:hypothetical protein